MTEGKCTLQSTEITHDEEGNEITHYRYVCTSAGATTALSDYLNDEGYDVGAAVYESGEYRLDAFKPVAGRSGTGSGDEIDPNFEG